jgi:hypothetical protein
MATITQINERVRRSPQEIRAALTSLGVVDSAGLCERKIEPTRWVVEDFLGEGLTLLSGRPKAGKSVLSMQLAIAVARGEQFLGRFAATKGSVLYVSIDDPSERRLQRHFQELGGGDRVVGIEIVTVLPDIENGGLNRLDQILQVMAEHEPAKLIVIDSLTAIRGTSRSKDLIKGDYDTMTRIRSVGTRHGPAVLVVHHTRKDGSNSAAVDAIDLHAGTTGISAAVDCAMVLVGPDDTRKTFKMKGRDVEPTVLNLELQVADHLGWRVVDAPTAPMTKGADISGTRKKIFDAVKALGRCKPEAIAKFFGSHSDSIRKPLQRMVSDQQIFRDADGLYCATLVSGVTGDTGDTADTAGNGVTVSRVTSIGGNLGDATTGQSSSDGRVITESACSDDAPPAECEDIRDSVTPVTEGADAACTQPNKTMYTGKSGNTYRLGEEDAKCLANELRVELGDAQAILGDAGDGADAQTIIELLRSAWGSIRKSGDRVACMRGIVTEAAAKIQELAPAKTLSTQPVPSPLRAAPLPSERQAPAAPQAQAKPVTATANMDSIVLAAFAKLGIGSRGNGKFSLMELGVAVGASSKGMANLCKHLADMTDRYLVYTETHPGNVLFWAPPAPPAAITLLTTEPAPVRIESKAAGWLPSEVSNNTSAAIDDDDNFWLAAAPLVPPEVVPEVGAAVADPEPAAAPAETVEEKILRILKAEGCRPLVEFRRDRGVSKDETLIALNTLVSDKRITETWCGNDRMYRLPRVVA